MLRVYSGVLSGFRRRSVLAVALFVFSGLAESVGIAALLPFLQGALEGEGPLEGSRFGLEGRGLAVAALVALVALGIVAAILRYIAEASVYRLQATVEESLRLRITAALYRMRWTAYARLSLGDTTKAIVTDGYEIGRGVQGVLTGVGNLLIAAVFVAVGLVISATMTLAILVFGAASALVYRAAGRRSQDASQSLTEQSTEITEMATELFGNAKYYRSTGRIGGALDRAGAVYGKWRADIYRVMHFQPSSRLVFDLTGITFVTAILAISVLFGGASPAEALVLVALFYRLAPKLQLAQQGLLLARSQIPWWRSWRKRFDLAVAEAEERGGTTILDHNPVIEVDSVTFTFPGRPTPALSSVSWRLHPGECLAIVGESGSGKTTMLDVLSGLLPPTAGHVLLDGVDLEQVDLESWRHRVGFVMQEAPLFFGSILDNIASTDPSPDRTKALRCAAIANVSDLISSLPDGLDTPVGHRGGRLSGGQRQRIALARALYGDPWILVLDEATSALDAASEQAIQDALRSLKGSLSLLLVAHRLKTVGIADRVVVLSNGRVVEDGSWDELGSRADGEFRRMLVAQRTAVPASSRRDG